MKPIIQPIDRELLKKELTKDKFLRPTNKADNQIYVITAHDSPNVMIEIGRLREHSFRTGGGGTGNEIDTDEYDYSNNPYKQLIVWDPKAEEIIGGYRFMEGNKVDFFENGQPKLVMSSLFTFSDKFIKEYLPYCIELGRAFVQPDYQTSKMGLKSLFALDNLWDGLGALIHSRPTSRYFIGKVTMYNTYNTTARELIYEYMFRYFPDPDQLIKSKIIVTVSEESKKHATEIFVGNNSSHDYKTLQKAVRQEGETIPSMFNAYIGLTDTMRMFGSIIDHEFGSVYETGIMVTMGDLLDSKRKRYIEPYIEYLKIIINEKERNMKLARAKRKEARLIKNQKNNHNSASE